MASLGAISSGFLFAAVTAAQPLTLGEVLFRANEYVVAYQKAFASVVAEERYLQRLVEGEEVRRTRDLRSDFLLIKVPDGDEWIGFRDVFEADGKPVRDRQERLEKLFLSPNALDQARRIADESARYNLGSVRRNINVPMLSLLFLHPLHQHRFNFEKIAEETVEGVPTWVLRYSEHVRPTLVRAGRGDVFARGRFWLDPANGRVVRSELILGDLTSTIRSTITVTYRPDEKLGVWVPHHMEEIYDNPRDPADERIESDATYSNFRRFDVRVDEKITVPKDAASRRARVRDRLGAV